MRKLILQEWISLDGFIEDKDKKLDFFTGMSNEANKQSDLDLLKFMKNIDAILLGRKTYELFKDFWPDSSIENEIIADRLNGTNKFVFSNTIQSAPWGKWPEANVVNGDAATEIKNLKAIQGKDMVLWGSITLAQALMTQDLIDEYHLFLCPVVVGGGRKLFQETSSYVNLDLIDYKKYPSGIMLLKYQPATV